MKKPTPELQKLIDILGGLKLVIKLGCNYYLMCDINALVVGDIKSKVCTHIRIMVQTESTYIMKFYKLTGRKLKVIDEVSGVTTDRLHELITKYTELEH